jgi:hypothetical protein
LAANFAELPETAAKPVGDKFHHLRQFAEIWSPNSVCNCFLHCT